MLHTILIERAQGATYVPFQYLRLCVIRLAKAEINIYCSYEAVEWKSLCFLKTAYCGVL